MSRTSSLYDFLDKKKIPPPTFVAANSNRLARVLPDEMDLYQLVESVSAIRSELNVVKAKLDAIPSEMFSSVMDSLTDITSQRCSGEVRGRLTSICRPIKWQEHQYQFVKRQTVGSNLCRMSDEEWSLRMD